ncbi:MAG: SHOCT domain-containing protein [Clostridiales bacterium]|nr:SHOCT domain-containing protein [Clostridiales bacterium]
MPGLYGLGMLGSLCFAIMGIVVGIWMIVLLYKSSVEMKAFSTSPIDTTKRTPGAGGFHNISVGSSRPSSARITSTKTSMSRAEAIKKAEEMRQRREAKASGSEVPETDAPAKPDLDKEQETIDMLKKYKELLDSGAITEEEFDAKKKELLG